MAADIIAIVISFIALVFSLIQFFVEKDRNRKEATIHAFDNLEENDNILFLFSLSNDKIDDFVKRKKEYDRRIEQEWSNLSNALPLIEHFAVGVNSRIYDIGTLNRMAGNQIITVFYACDELIKYKRIGQGKEKNYIEFETMVEKLIEVRKKRIKRYQKSQADLNRKCRYY